MRKRTRSSLSDRRYQLETLKRRRAHLQMRTLSSDRQGQDFDKAELIALTWAIELCEAYILERKRQIESEGEFENRNNGLSRTGDE